MSIDLTSAALAPKRYVAWSEKTGLFLGANGHGFTETRREFSPGLGETELMVIRYMYPKANIAWEKL